jgi:hypothetical protein
MELDLGPLFEARPVEVVVAAGAVVAVDVQTDATLQ